MAGERPAVLAEFDSPAAMLAAVRRLRELGYELDTYTPYPVPETERALGLGPSPLPRFVLIAGLVGASGAYLLQWWMSAVDYPLNVGGRPPHAAPAFVIITFEMAVLLAGITAFLAVFALSRLPRLWHPVFEVEGFERASVDRFWLAVDGKDGRVDFERARRELLALHPLRVVSLGAAGPGGGP